MKILLIIYFLITLNISSNALADIKLDQDFPIEMQGIWSSDCSTTNNINSLIIYDYGSLYLEYGDYSYVSLSVSKTTNFNSWTVYEWSSNGMDKTKYFLKLQNDKLIEKYPPNNWNEIDYEFLNDSTSQNITLYEKCNSIPTVLSLFYGPIINFSDSNVPKLRNSYISQDKNMRNKCKISLMNYFDVSKDLELSAAEITRAIKLLVLYLYMNNAEQINPETVPISKLLSFTIVPSLSQLFLLNYDFDNSQTLSTEEIRLAYFDLDEGKKVLNQNYQNLDIKEIIDSITDLLNY